MRQDRSRIGACLAISLAGHLMAAILLTSTSVANNASPDQDKGQEAQEGKDEKDGLGAFDSDFLDKSKNHIQARLIAPGKDQADAQHKEADMSDASPLADCKPTDKSYEGVGISYLNFSGQIQLAPENYPGYKAGLRVGDMVDNPGASPIDGYLVLKSTDSAN